MAWKTLRWVVARMSVSLGQGQRWQWPLLMTQANFVCKGSFTALSKSANAARNNLLYISVLALSKFFFYPSSAVTFSTVSSITPLAGMALMMQGVNPL